MPMGGGITPTKGVKGSFTFSGGSTHQTIDGISKITTIFWKFDSAISITDGCFDNTVWSLTFDENGDELKNSTMIAYKTYGVNNLSNNEFDFTHWNNTSQTIYYYALGF